MTRGVSPDVTHVVHTRQRPGRVLRSDLRDDGSLLSRVLYAALGPWAGAIIAVPRAISAEGGTMPSSTLSRQDELTQVADAHLVGLIYDLVGGLDDDPVSDEFYFLLTEAVERFAPNVELEVNRPNILEADGRVALAAYVEGLGRRHAMRLTARAERQDLRERGIASEEDGDG